jgi:hypothetical protein
MNKWVAVLAYGSENETIVASGDTIVQARTEAESQPLLFIGSGVRGEP